MERDQKYNVVEFLKNDIFFFIEKIPIEELKHDFDKLNIRKSEFKFFLRKYEFSRKVVEDYWKGYYKKKKERLKKNNKNI